MKKLTILTTIFSGFISLMFSEAAAQGCVAIRGTGGATCLRPQDEKNATGWLLNINNRYFKSYKHFRGAHEEHERVENGTEVINHTYSMDIFLAKNLNRKWSLGVNLPIIYNGRSSMYEHGGNNGGANARHSTHSFGIGDIRLAAYYWFVDPAKGKKWNVQAGLGLKLPTGDYRYQDYFIKNDSTKLLGPVDQSIQLGDGGTGITAEINAYYAISRQFSAYANFYYLANPREQNGVSTSRGGTTSSANIANGSDVMSVPDQYMIRAGLNYAVNQVMLSAGIRQECVPVYNLIGGSNGFRRPGYVLSVEPGITYQMKRVTAYALVPIAIERNRTQSVPDKIRTRLTGNFSQGDAAFADYAVNVGVSVRF